MHSKKPVRTARSRRKRLPSPSGSIAPAMSLRLSRTQSGGPPRLFRRSWATKLKAHEKELNRSPMLKSPRGIRLKTRRRILLNSLYAIGAGLQTPKFSKQGILEPSRGEGKRTRAEQIAAKANGLFEAETPVSCFRKAGVDYGHQVAAALRSLYLRSDIPMGGARLNDHNLLTRFQTFHPMHVPSACALHPAPSNLSI